MVYESFKNKEQEEFYIRTTKAINGENILINRGGMGLGKTYAVVKAIEDNKDKYDTFLVCTPFSVIKEHWSKEINQTNLKDNQIIWYSKKHYCRLYKEGKIKNQSQIYDKCKDNCKYMCKLKSNRVFSAYNDMIIENLHMPLNDKELYKLGKDVCIIPLVQNAVYKKKIVIADYFFFLFPRTIKHYLSEQSPKKEINESCLIIDEAHLLYNRAKQIYSKKINLSNILKRINKNITFWNGLKNGVDYNDYEDSIFTLVKVEEILSNNKEKSSMPFDKFTLLFDNLRIRQEKSPYFIDFFEDLKNLTSSEDKKYDDNDKTPERILYEFISFWNDKQGEDEYKTNFQYVYNKKTKINNLYLEISCSDPGKQLSKLWYNWKNIILISGTINYPIEQYKQLIGLNNHNVLMPDILESYKIKDNVKRFAYGDFTSKNRIKTFNLIKKDINNIIKEILIKGNIIIYLLNKNDSFEIKKILNDNFKLFNFCDLQDEDLSDQEVFEKTKKEFDDSFGSIGLMNLKGRVEGQNFNNLKCIIVLGYPWKNRDIEYNDHINYNKNKFIMQGYSEKISLIKAKELVEYYDNDNLLYQAVSRAKRNEYDNPIIILWGKEYNDGFGGVKYLNEQLKGEIIWENNNKLGVIRGFLE